jgi:hypothetical protein
MESPGKDKENETNLDLLHPTIWNVEGRAVGKGWTVEVVGRR